MGRTLTSALLVCCLHHATAQVFYADQRARWLDSAAALVPTLVETEHQPVRTVRLVADSLAYQGWAARPDKPLDSVYAHSLKAESGVVLDFGQHLTGYVTIVLQTIASTADAPTRLRLTFGEVPAELATPFDPYDGALSRAWLQDEIVTFENLPDTLTLARRLAFRYVKVEVLGSSRYFDFRLARLSCRALTSARRTPDGLAPQTGSRIRAIDSVGLATLRECMQTVYEDGPKRDRRLWIGDLYLEALSNAYSFRNHDLTKRCLYLLAGLSREDGYVHSNVFEQPEPHAQVPSPFLFDYSMLFNAALTDYVAATGDIATGADLWPVARRQLDNVGTFLDPEGLFDAQAAAAAGWWLFVDWSPELDRQGAIQGIMLFGLRKTRELAQRLGHTQELPAIDATIARLTQAAQARLYRPQSGLYVSGSTEQVSYATQAWMVLGGVATGEQAKRALLAVASSPTAVRPGAPYLYHYYIEALLSAGLKEEAKATLLDYWGGMVDKGADTFWEVYDPLDDRRSPYGFFPINSYCHAWSCTPVYFIRKYPEVFQGGVSTTGVGRSR